MKIFLIRILQFLLGFERYLYVFSRFVIATLKWNRREKDFLYFVSLLPDNGIVLDVGANIGAMTTHLAKKLKNSFIYSFEPVSYNITALKKIVKYYKLNNVKVVETALGNVSGEVQMLLPTEKKVRRQGLSFVTSNSINIKMNGEFLVVPVRTLDSMEEFVNSKRVTGIKLDVENYEYFVLDGARRLIENHRPVIYTELWENENREKCFDLITRFDYLIKVLDHGKLNTYDPKIYKMQNFFFIPTRQN